MTKSEAITSREYEELAETLAGMVATQEGLESRSEAWARRVVELVETVKARLRHPSRRVGELLRG